MTDSPVTCELDHAEDAPEAWTTVVAAALRGSVASFRDGERLASPAYTGLALASNTSSPRLLVPWIAPEYN